MERPRTGRIRGVGRGHRDQSAVETHDVGDLVAADVREGHHLSRAGEGRIAIPAAEFVARVHVHHDVPAFGDENVGEPVARVVEREIHRGRRVFGAWVARIGEKDFARDFVVWSEKVARTRDDVEDPVTIPVGRRGRPGEVELVQLLHAEARADLFVREHTPARDPWFPRRGMSPEWCRRHTGRHGRTSPWHRRHVRWPRRLQGRALSHVQQNVGVEQRLDRVPLRRP